MAQVVPIKLDTGSESWQTWARQHKAEGNGIPIVYVVRADGETLYARSGTLTDQQLKQLLGAALANAGTVFGERDAQIIQSVTEKFRNFRTAGDPKSAIKSLKQAKRYLGKTGQVVSYAKPAIELNQEIQLLIQAAEESVQQAADEIVQAKKLTTKEQIRAIQKYLGVKDRYSDLKSSKAELAKIQTTIRKHAPMKTLYEEIKTIETAAAAKSASQKKRAQDKLGKLIESTQFPLIKAQAEAILAQLKE